MPIALAATLSGDSEGQAGSGDPGFSSDVVSGALSWLGYRLKIFKSGRSTGSWPI